MDRKEVFYDHIISSSVWKRCFYDSSGSYSIKYGSWLESVHKSGRRRKSLIPVYNTFTLYKISWNTHNFWLYFGFSVVSSVIEAIGGEDPGFLMTILSVLVSILLIYYEVKVCIYLSKSFGMDTLFGILTFFLRFVGYLVIGFGNAYYTGPAGANDQGISL